MTNQQGAPEALRTIQRYKIGYHTDEWGARSSTPGGISDPSGQWVLYKDHVAALVEAQQPAPSAAAVVGTNTKTAELLSTTVGLLMGYREGGARQPYKPGSVVAKVIDEVVDYLKDWPYPEPSPTPQADPLQPIVGLQEQAGMYADDFAPQADSQPAPVVGRMSPSKEWLETRLAIADDSGVQAGVPPKNARPCDAPPGCNSHNCLECNDYPRAARAQAADSVTAPAGGEIDRLRAALVYVAFALHGKPQYMLAEGIALIDGDTVRVSRDGWTVEASTLRLQAIAAQADSQPAPVLPESLTLAVDRWFSENTGLGGCSDKDVSELAELFYGAAHAGGRESVDDALAIVESFGPGIGGLNDTYARQILLAEEVKRLRAARAPADSVTAPAWARHEKALEDTLRERDEADEFIDTLLDEVLGADRAEWSSAYGRAEALEEVRERITALHKPAVDRSWAQFETAIQQACERVTVSVGSQEFDLAETGSHFTTADMATACGQAFREGQAAPTPPAQAADSVLEDAALMDWLRENTCDLRCIGIPTGGDDYEVNWIVIEHHMAKPNEREIGRGYTDDPRDAIRAARKQGANHD